MKLSIQSVLILVLLIAAPLGGFMNRQHQRRQVIQLVASLGGTARLDSQPTPNYHPLKGLSVTKPPAWAANWIGEDIRSSIDDIVIEDYKPDQEQVLTEVLKQTGALQKLRLLHIQSRNFSKFDFQPLRNLKNVRILQLQKFDLDAKDLDAISRMKSLEMLLLKDSVAEPSQLERLSRLPRLTWLLIEQGEFPSSEFTGLRDSLPDTHLNVLPKTRSVGGY